MEKKKKVDFPSIQTFIVVNYMIVQITIIFDKTFVLYFILNIDYYEFVFNCVDRLISHYYVLSEFPFVHR